MGSSACGLWQGVCTYPLYSELVVTFSNKHSESTICADTVQTSMMMKKGKLLRDRVIECSWMSDNKWVICTLIIYLFSVNTFTPIERCAICETSTYVVSSVNEYLLTLSLLGVHFPNLYVHTYSILLGPHRGVPDILA